MDCSPVWKSPVSKYELCVSISNAIELTAGSHNVSGFARPKFPPSRLARFGKDRSLGRQLVPDPGATAGSSVVLARSTSSSAWPLLWAFPHSPPPRHHLLQDHLQRAWTFSASIGNRAHLQQSEKWLWWAIFKVPIHDFNYPFGEEVRWLWWPPSFWHSSCYIFYPLESDEGFRWGEEDGGCTGTALKPDKER